MRTDTPRHAKPSPARPSRVSTNASLLLATELADTLRDIGPILVKRFFGGYGLVLEGVQFAFVMKASLYLRADEHQRSNFERLGGRPFSYATRNAQVTVASYYGAPAEVVDDAVALRVWAVEAYAAALTAQRQSPRKLAPSQSGLHQTSARKAP